MLFSPWHRPFSSRLRQSTRSVWPILALVVALTAASSCTPGPMSSVTQADLPVQLVNNLLFVSGRVGSSAPLSFIWHSPPSSSGGVGRTGSARLSPKSYYEPPVNAFGNDWM